ncbi:MAG: helix-turn-helix transcriptional regulator [Eubacteriales bacterium]|nr:helix-turn-helix transcriptional regulator [Eubacteriales bacterium]
MTTVGERLIYLLEEQDMKQTELAERVGISKQSLYKYLHCKCEPRAEVIAKMADALNTTADFIVGLTNDPKAISRDETDEQVARKETELLSKFRRLSVDDQIRIEERMNIMLEQ